MSENSFKVGQVWRQRDGNLCTIESVGEDIGFRYPVETSEGRLYTVSGRYWDDEYAESPFDLVELVQDVDGSQQEQQAETASVGDVGGFVSSTLVSNDRQQFIAQAILTCIHHGHDVHQMRQYVALYDELVGAKAA